MKLYFCSVLALKFLVSHAAMMVTETSVSSLLQMVEDLYDPNNFTARQQEEYNLAYKAILGKNENNPLGLPYDLPKIMEQINDLIGKAMEEYEYENFKCNTKLEELKFVIDDMNDRIEIGKAEEENVVLPAMRSAEENRDNMNQSAEVIMKQQQPVDYQEYMRQRKIALKEMETARQVYHETKELLKIVLKDCKMDPELPPGVTTTGTAGFLQKSSNEVSLNQKICEAVKSGADPTSSNFTDPRVAEALKYMASRGQVMHLFGGSPRHVCENAESSCNLIADKWTTTWGAHWDSMNRIKNYIFKLDAEWDELKTRATGQVNFYVGQQNWNIEALAKMDLQRLAQEKSRKDLQLEKEVKEREYQEESEACNATIDDIKFNLLCAYVRLRTNLRLEHKLFVEDCEVEAWMPGDCKDKRTQKSVFCPYPEGFQGGKREYTREKGSFKLTNNSNATNYGLKCEKMITTLTLDCGTKPCPVDCANRTDWLITDQKECAVTCGPFGTMQLKKFFTPPSYGGKVCPQDKKSETCPPVKNENNQDVFRPLTCKHMCKLTIVDKWCPRICGAKPEHLLKRSYAGISPIECPDALPCACKAAPWAACEDTAYERECDNDERLRDDINVIIAIDGSGSVGNETYQAMKLLANKL